MLRTFNCGIGMVVCVSADDRDRAIEILQQQGESVSVIGQIHNCDCKEPCVKYQ